MLVTGTESQMFLIDDCIEQRLEHLIQDNISTVAVVIQIHTGFLEISNRVSKQWLYSVIFDAIHFDFV